MAKNLTEAVTRLAQMQEHDRAQLKKMDDEWSRLMTFAYRNLENAMAAVDDIAAMLGVIEPRPGLPMLPANGGSGPRPVFEAVKNDDAAP